MTTAVGLIGLGAMGTAIAVRLRDRGFTVVATSRSSAKSPADVVAELGAEAIVLTSVPSGPEVDDVVFGAAGLLAGLRDGARLTLADLSTCAPHDSLMLEDRLDRLGHRAVDAPVSGGPDGARTGTLSIMAGGKEAALDAVESVLAALGTTTRCGGPGTGQVVKACNQLLVATGLVAVAEALTLARLGGVAPETARTALLGGFAASRVLELQGDRMVRRDFAPRGSVELLAKDIGIIAGLAGAAGLPTPVLEAAGVVVDRLALRDPGVDHSAVITVVEEEEST